MRYLPRALELLRASDAMARATETARTYVDTAHVHLDEVGDATAVKALRRLASYALDRVG